jgi:pseudouridine kinase
LSKIIVIGGINNDIYAYSKSYIKQDSNIGVIKYSHGGVGRNVSQNLSQIGFEVIFLGAVGDDNTGIEILNKMKNFNIDISKIIISNKYPTSSYLSISNDEGDMSFAVSSMDIMEEVSIDYIKKYESIIENSSIIFIDANLPSATIEYICQSFTKPIFFDAVSISKSYKAKNILDRIHTLKVNLNEAYEIFCNKERSIEKVILGSSKYNNLRIFLTDGENGSYYLHNKTIKHFPINKKNIINANGAGDSYTGGLIASQILNLSIESTIKLSSKMAYLTANSDKSVSELINSRILEVFK